ncbi:hypothetical protein K402DRAFT_337139, partial [Aulographum hederae CBS 113979]
FSNWYLRQLTSELADDLDELRSASDFHAGESLAVLVHALRQGERVFERRERERIGGGG